MLYCITEGKTDSIILSTIIKNQLNEESKMIVSSGIPSIPAVARTILSFIQESDKVIVVCDQDSFDDENYQKGMLGFLLRGAMNNPQLKVFIFNPNIDILIPEQNKTPGWKRRASQLPGIVNEHIASIAENETVKAIIQFISEPLF